MTRATRPKARYFIVQTWRSQANLSVFLGLLVVTVFVLPALSGRVERITLTTNLVASVVLTGGVAIAWGRKWLLAAGVMVAIPAIVLRWLEWLTPGPRLNIWNEAGSLAAVVMIIVIVLAQVFRGGRVSSTKVQGAVAAYLLLGIAYAHGYRIASLLDPSAITSTEGPLKSAVDWMYFSFSTLSTVGYGDIVPTGRMSRMLAIGEAVTGQLYLAILIARLVAMEVSSRGEKSA